MFILYKTTENNPKLWYEYENVLKENIKNEYIKLSNQKHIINLQLGLRDEFYNF